MNYSLDNIHDNIYELLTNNPKLILQNRINHQEKTKTNNFRLYIIFSTSLLFHNHYS